MKKAELATWNQAGKIIKKRKLNFWYINDDGFVGIAISLNSPDENPTKKGNGKEIYISLKNLKQEFKEKGIVF